MGQASEMLGYKMETRKNRQAGNVMEFIVHGESSTREAKNTPNPLHFEATLEEAAKEGEEYEF